MVCLRGKQKDLKQVLCLVIKKLCVIGMDKRAISPEAALQPGKLVSLGEKALPPKGSNKGRNII